MVKQRKKYSEKRRRTVQKLLALLDSSNESDDSNDECSVPVVNLNLTPVSPSAGPNQGPNVHHDISDLLSTVLHNGLNPDSREFALVSYPLLGNCSALNPPQINPEIKANLNHCALKKDEYLRNVQLQLAAGISALAVPLDRQYERSRLDRSEVARKELASISDPIKMFSDVFHSISIKRRRMLLPQINVGLTRKKLRELPLDDMLFGKCLAKRIGRLEIETPLLSMNFQPTNHQVQSQCHIPTIPAKVNGNLAVNNMALKTSELPPQASASHTLSPGHIKRKRTKAATRKAQSKMLQFVAKSGNGQKPFLDSGEKSIAIPLNPMKTEKSGSVDSSDVKAPSEVLQFPALQSDVAHMQIHQQHSADTTETTTLKIKVEKDP